MLEKLHQLKLMDGILAVGIVLIIVGLGISLRENKAETKVEVESNSINSENKMAIIKADIEGEVIKPGVYELKGGSRVEDLLVTAGGLTAKADRDWVKVNINRAQVLYDGQKILIPKTGESIESAEVDGVVRINSATEAELDTLPGVGPAMAKRIIDYRSENNGFKNVEELKLVKGIGDKMWQELKGKVSL